MFDMRSHRESHTVASLKAEPGEKPLTGKLYVAMLYTSMKKGGWGENGSFEKWLLRVHPD